MGWIEFDWQIRVSSTAHWLVARFPLDVAAHAALPFRGVTAGFSLSLGKYVR